MSEQAVLVGFVIFMVIWMTFLALIMTFIEVRKTKKYRRELGDLYVAAKIKKIAKGETIDLDEEKVSFLDWSKKNKVKDVYQNYDDVVEEEMKEQVVDSLTTKTKK